ncbi:hypothetical protein BGX27_006181, partial [Mortierella sp. AM989]
NPALRQKKISIDLQRILSLLKTHDPRRCTVCCNGGEFHDHDGHHHHHGEQHQRHHNQQQHHLSPAGSGVKPTAVRQNSSDSAKASTKGLRYAIADELDSETSLSSIPSDDENTGPSKRKHGESSSSKSHQQRNDDQPPRRRDELSRSYRGKNDAPTPEQKLHVILRQLEEEVQQLRRSYFELSRDLEAIERSTDAAYVEGNNSSGNVERSNGEPSSSSANEASAMRTSASKADKRSKAFKERQLRQKKM